MKKSVFGYFAKITEKHLCQSLSLRPATLLKKRLWHKCFPVNFAKFLRISKNSKVSFHEVDNETIIKEIKRLNKNKASQKSDIPITIIHRNAAVFADCLAESLKGAVKTYNFPNLLKLSDIT